MSVPFTAAALLSVVLGAGVVVPPAGSSAPAVAGVEKAGVLAATVTYADPVVTIRAEPGVANDISVNWRNVPGEPNLQVQDPVTFEGQTIKIDVTCGGAPGEYTFDATCENGGENPPVMVALGDGNDIGSSYNSNALGQQITIFGGEGDDELRGGSSTDTFYGAPGNDLIRVDDDVLDINRGDYASGGQGVDTLEVHRYAEGLMVITLDGVADDGDQGIAENDNYLADIENVVGARSAPNLIRATSAVNRVTGGDLDDRIEVRDGVADTVDCGGGTDTVVADRIDVLTGCELVDLGPAVPGGATATTVSVGSRTLDANRQRTRAVTKVRCPVGAGRCRGRIVVAAGKTRMGTAAYSVKAGKVGKVVVRLTPQARQKLSRRAKVKVVVTLKPKGADRVVQAGVLKR